MQFKIQNLFSSKLNFLCLFFAISSITAIGQGLRTYATEAGLNFGTMATIQQFRPNPKGYKDTLSTQFNMTFPGNELKFKNVEKERGVFNFAYSDSVIAFAEAHGMKSRGHCLIWHSFSQNPAWLTDRWYGTNPWSRAELLSIMKTHITSVVSHYKGRISEWDVINEGIGIGDGHPNGLRKSPWQSIIGDDYIDSAFVYAHRADPTAYLYFNEYGGEGAIASEYAKRDTVYNLAKRLLARGIPIHGIGFEAHFGNYVNTGAISANMKKLGELGLRVSITELDMMNTTNLPNNWKNLMNACLENYNCTSFVTWGIDDKTSWMGSDCGCLIWDSTFVRKSAVYKVLSDAMKAANPNISAQRKAFAAQLPYPQTPLPKAATPTINYCQGETAVPLSVVGSKLRWYSTLTGNVYDLFAPTPSTKDVGTKSYFVSQTISGLESQRVEIKITVTAPTTWYQDLDGDGKGDQMVKLVACAQPTGYVKEASTGINDISSDNNLNVYPLPFKESVMIRLNNGDNQIVGVRILNLSGVTVEQNDEVNKSFISVGAGLSKGVYIALITTSNKTYSTRIVKL